MSDFKNIFDSSDFETMVLLPVGTEFLFAVIRQAVKPAPPQILAFFLGFIDIS